MLHYRPLPKQANPLAMGMVYTGSKTKGTKYTNYQRTSPNAENVENKLSRKTQKFITMLHYRPLPKQANSLAMGTVYTGSKTKRTKGTKKKLSTDKS